MIYNLNLDQPIYYTYTLPTLEERRAKPAARIAYFAHVMLVQEGVFPVIAMCVTCGASTGNTCETCEEEGRHFTTTWGQSMLGSPMCTMCEDDGEECTVCGAVAYTVVD